MLNEINSFSEQAGLRNMGLSNYFHTILNALIGNVIPGGIVLSVLLVMTPALLGHLHTLKEASHLHYPILLFASLFIGVTCNGIAFSIFQFLDRQLGIIAGFDAETFDDYCRHRYLAMDADAISKHITEDLKAKLVSNNPDAVNEAAKLIEGKVLTEIRQDTNRRYFRGASSIPLMLGSANPVVREQLKNTLSALEAELMFSFSMCPVPVIVTAIAYHQGNFSLPLEDLVSLIAFVIFITGVWIYHAYHALKTYRSRLIMFYLGLTLTSEPAK